jgi:hypothetical protein
MGLRRPENGVVCGQLEDYHSVTAVAEQISESELQSRMLAVENAVAQQELEGLTVSTEAAEDMRRVARGEMTVEQAIANVHARLNDAAILRS